MLKYISFSANRPDANIGAGDKCLDISKTEAASLFLKLYVDLNGFSEVA